MRTRSIAVGAIVAVAIAAGLYATYTLGMNRGMAMTSAGDAAKPGGDGRRVLYWHDPMVPGTKFDKPGKSPFMGMQLVPVYAEGDGQAASGVRIDPAVQQNLGVRTAEVTKTRIGQRLQAVGNVAYNERDVALVQARANGYVERLLVRAPLDRVSKGQPLAEIYVPDWIAVQEEYLAVRRLGANAPAGLEEATRQRMRLAGMSEAQVAAVQREGQKQTRATVVSPIAGVVSELTAREGMSVANGAPLFRINGMGTVWVIAQVAEALAAEVHLGTAATVRTAAFPDETFKGKVSALLPEVDPSTRTLKARVEVSNIGSKLSPGMFARVEFSSGEAREVLAVPTEAVIRTGTRSVVMVASGNGGFALAEVETGIEANGKTEVRKGLSAGDKVAVSGQFLIDSEASLKGIEARSAGAVATAAKPAAAGETHRAVGKVERIADGEITLSHGPIPSLHWPGMTMAFKAPVEGTPTDVKVGDTVDFEIRRSGDDHIVTAIRKKEPSR